MEAISHAGTVLAVLSKEGIALAAEKASHYPELYSMRYADFAWQKVTGKLLDLSLTAGGEGIGGEGAQAWLGGGGEKIFLLNKLVEYTGVAEIRAEAFVAATFSLVSLGSHPMPIPSSTFLEMQLKNISISTTKIFQWRCSSKGCAT